MIHVSVSELRQNLPAFLERVRKGEEVQVTRRGEVIARITPAVDAREESRRALELLRSRARVGDVESPISVGWEAGDDP